MTTHFLRSVFTFCSLTAALGLESSWADEQDRIVESPGIKAWIGNDESTARLSIERLGKFEFTLNVNPGQERNPIQIDVRLDETGRETWPAEDLYVETEGGRSVFIRRNGIQWHEFELIVPPERESYVIRCVRRAARSASLPREAERRVASEEEGLSVSISRWPGGKDAALSIRFDDSHPTHLSKVVPTLGEYGFRATFMINPGRADYQRLQAEWEALARSGDHELGNHTLHHRGAGSEEEIEREIGDVSRYLWGLLPEKSKLLALNRGGGTKWSTRRPFSYHLEEYHLFHVDGSLGMDDVYGDRPQALLRHVERHIGRGLWCRVHFHSVGPGLATSAGNFRAAMDVVRELKDSLWITGLADAYKYRQERSASRLRMKRTGPGRIELQLVCGTDPELYDLALTLEVALTRVSTGNVSLIHDSRKIAPSADRVSQSGQRIVFFDVPPIDADYEIRIEP